MAGILSNPDLGSGNSLTAQKHSSRELCPRCISIGTPNSNAEENSINVRTFVLHLGFNGDIIQVDDCPCCNMLQDMVDIHVHHRQSDSIVSSGQWSLYAFWPSRKKVETRSSLIFSPEQNDTYHDSESQQLGNSPALVVVNGNIGVGKRNSRAPILAASRRGFFAPAATGSQVRPIIDFVQIRSWIEHCSKHHHKSCAQANDLLTPDISLIDCHTLKIVKFNSNVRYVALSYVWGTSAQSPSHLLNESWPATIKDAVAATLELGYSYLWVDRYCISQDVASGERSAQIAMMDRIYRGAEITIIAASGDNPTYGLPGMPSHRRTQLRSVIIGSREYLAVPPEAPRQIQVSTWNTRGWTYQEAAFSKRRLVFLNSEVYFECNEMKCSDSNCRPMQFEDVRTERLHHGRLSNGKMEGTFMGVTKGTHPIDDIFLHLSNYTDRQLSLPEDILNGMLGIFQEFERHHKSFLHFYGVAIARDFTMEKWQGEQWMSSRKEQFLLGLYWKSREPCRRRPGFPSWSWTGWFGRIEPRGFWDGHIHDVFDVNVRILGIEQSAVEISNCTASIYDRVTQPLKADKARAASLVITAPTVPVWLQFALNPGPEILPEVYVTVGNKFKECSKFSLTQKLDEETHVLRETVNKQLEGIVLGLRMGSYYGGEDQQRVINDDDTHLAIMIIRHREDGRAERFGLVELDHDLKLTKILGALPRKEIFLV